MERKDMHFASWIISLTSILYGTMSMLHLSDSISYGYFSVGNYQNTYYTPYILLIIFGIIKIVGLKKLIPKIRRISIIGLMFSWGFIWTTAMVDFIIVGPNRITIVIIPIIAICFYVALRGDYIDDWRIIFRSS